MGKRQNMSATFTSDFRHGFATETDSLLRRRFMWFTGVVLALSLLVGALLPAVIILNGGIDTYMTSTGHTPKTFGMMIATVVVQIGIYATGFVYGWLGHPSGSGLIRLTMIVVILDGLLSVLMRALQIPTSPGLLGFGISHVLACLFLPWTPMQALRPALVVLGISALSRLTIEGSTIFGGFGGLGGDAVAISLSPLVAMPGTLICAFRQSRRIERYKLRFLQQRYGEVRRELVDARRIHESLFPRPIETGPARVMYAYEPMRQIGGDFLFVHESESDATLSVVLIDVTGHGIPAALTVNRLHGELQRLFAEDPLIHPGQVLRLLNRYVHLTLAIHSVYVTALCVRLDHDAGRLEYASGGHPPAFVRAVDGRIDRLESTAFVLGACADEDFDHGARSVEFGVGDAMIAYTDGATEARDKTGRMLGIRGLEEIVATAKPEKIGDWPEIILGRVEQHRFGPPDDDTLVIELFRPIGVEQPEATND